MSELLDTKPRSNEMDLHIAAMIRAEELRQEFDVWAVQRQQHDSKQLASILRAWGFAAEGVRWPN